ncbi:polysaccharide deacetylase family protein [Candidatus Pelagibacter sp.]|nr:polysaccharide deacetylase family protein [Candidatus Pelagibacter sp.]
MFGKKKIPILMYHDVSNKNKENDSVHYKKFFKQILFIRALGYKSVNLCDIRKNNHKKVFVITFDDGYQNLIKFVLPFLKKNNFKATCFIVSNSIGKFNYWDKHKVKYKKKKIMNIKEIKSWLAAGLEIGSHTLNHYNLTSLNDTDKLLEITKPIELFKKKLGINVKTFSYPFGKYDNKTIKIVKKYYKFAVSTKRSRYIKDYFDINVLPRIPVNYDTSIFKLFLKTSTIYEDIKYKND